MADDRHGADFSPRPQLRIAALLAVSTLLFVPLQAYYLEPAALLKVAPFYVFAAALGGVLLVLTYTAFGVRYAQQLSLLFALGLTAEMLLYPYFEPYATPTYPAVVANLMTCLLMGTTVLFAWPTWRAILSGSLMTVGFALVAGILTSRGLPTAPFALAIGSLVAGVLTVAASARVVERFRPRPTE